MELFLTDPAYLNDPHSVRVFLSELKNKEKGEKFRAVLANSPQFITELMAGQVPQVCDTRYVTQFANYKHIVIYFLIETAGSASSPLNFHHLCSSV